MAGCLRVSDYAVVLGKTALTDWALQLDAVPVAANLAMQHKQLAQFNSVADIADDLPLAERLVLLLQLLWQQLTRLPDAAPVLLVLPEQLAGEAALQDCLTALQQAFPTLLSHPACQLYPYGRSAALMALAAARQLLAAGEQQVWLVGLDSPVAAMLADTPLEPVQADTQATEPVVWSEGAVALCLTRSDSGLNCQYLASDASVSQQIDEPALAQLFTAVASKVAQPLRRLYLADNGSEALTACWQGQYPRLAGVINIETELMLPAYYTGELGAAGGVYRLLHLYLGYSQAMYNGLTLQCEISEKLYRAVAVFSWQQASTLSDI
ncbi:hypothetical protein WG68_05185 [Arsukibacterium ikkense]|uniref:Beta-ketoacyl synthase N-terminal domain-containing protein n=1 Tax=Arsukibacterium ikkense TaxID=336831 RepID=A0A0M2V774_9GAMM|nr:hypothetical protein [Arsukibacterium ikkense]KKO46677.1 hypothetical protein WG68_05185 [Arsukibacterium ikkense]